MILIDDLQWSDAPTLRFVAYLARRVADLPVLIAVSVRSGEPATDDALLAEVAGDPVTVPVRPVALSSAATTTLVRARLGEDADQAFARRLPRDDRRQPAARRPAARRARRRARHAGRRARRGGPRDRAARRVAHVLLRLARLPQPAVALARAVADPRRAAAGCPRPPRSRDQRGGGGGGRRRARARRTSCGPASRSGSSTRSCATRSTASSPAAQRGLEHARAARVLEQLGAGADQIASQLLAAPPRGDAWVVERLREAAARRARARGAGERDGLPRARAGRAAAGRPARGARARARRRRAVRQRPDVGAAPARGLRGPDGPGRAR